MLHLALAALLAGPFSTGALAAPADGDKDKAPRTEAAVGLSAAEDDALLVNTYGFGQPEPTFINIWAGFGWANVDEHYNAAGNEYAAPDQTFMRAFVGTQINLLRLNGLTFAVGGQLMMGSLDVTGHPLVGDFDSGFELNSLMFYGQLSGRTLGLHVGYVLDLTDDPAEGEIRQTRGHDAFMIGFTFDYQPAWLRIFGGTDLFRLVDVDLEPGQGTGFDSPALLVFNLGAGVQFDWVELGLAALWRTNLVEPQVIDVSTMPLGTYGGSHQLSFAPYLHLSPPFLPVGISARGAVFGDFADYGFSTMGAMDKVSQMGFTVALTYGF